MLNCMIDDGHGSVFVKGSVTDIMADVTILVKKIYDGLDKDAAHVFKAFVADLLPELPFADTEELEEMDKRYKKAREESKENFNNAMKMLKNLFNEMDLEEDEE